jgi:branched-chain amino acid transport system substrate-binding protein
MPKLTKTLVAGVIIAVFVGIMGFSSLALAKDKVKIAFIGPLTGIHEKMGTSCKNAFLLAVNQWNASGKNKYIYEVVTLDDECVPAKGVQAATKAASDPDIVAVGGHYCSMVAITTTEVFHKFELSNVVWGAVLPDITYGNNYKEVSRVNGTQVEQNKFNASLVVDKLGFKKFAIIHDTTDYGRGHLKYFEAELKSRKANIVGIYGVTIEQKDFSTILSQIKSLNPEVVYFGGLTPSGVLIKMQMDKLDIKAQFLGTSGIKADDFNTTLGEHAEGVICMLDGAPVTTLKGGPEFAAAYRKAFDTPIEAYAPFAYSAANVIMKAIEKVGPDRAKLVEAISKTDTEDIIGRIHYNEFRQNDSALVTAYVSQDGKWVSWNDSEYASNKRMLPGLAFKKGSTWQNPYKPKP